MRNTKIAMYFGIFVLVLSLAYGYQSEESYEITITNLTRGQVVTPPLVYSYNGSFNLFQEGKKARPQLATLAETGATDPLATKLGSVNRIFDLVTGDGVIFPGESMTLELKSDVMSRYFTAVGMLAQTNDGFFGIQKARLPEEGEAVYFAPAYDAGSEGNNEMGLFIPGPPFGGSLRDIENAENYVHIHAGIHGIADLFSQSYDWRNPVVKITVKRIG